MAALLSIEMLRRHEAQPATLAHDIAGRLRAIVPQVRDNPKGGDALCSILRSIDGVTDVRANPNSGSVTVRYENCATVRAQVLEALGHPELAPSRPRTKGVADLLAEALAKHLADVAMHAIVAALV